MARNDRRHAEASVPDAEDLELDYCPVCGEVIVPDSMCPICQDTKEDSQRPLRPAA